jgi:AraC-like DNA-binding protein
MTTTIPEILSTRVLENIAALSSASVLRGQDEPSRLSRRRRFPKVDFYGEEPMKGGLPGHRHAWPELATVLAGRLNLILGEVVYEARQGDWLVFGPNVAHGECCLTTHARYELLWFVANPAYLGVHMTRYTRSRGYEVLATSRLDQTPTDLKRLCTRAWTSLAESRTRLVRVVSACLDRLMQEPGRARTRVHPLVEEVKGLLLASAGRPPSVVELANQVGLSPNYLSNLFHRETGQTIRRFIESQRMESACRQLANPERSGKQIAYDLGFADARHFSHAFRRATGASPTAYRRRLIEDPDT